MNLKNLILFIAFILLLFPACQHGKQADVNTTDSLSLAQADTLSQSPAATMEKWKFVETGTGEFEEPLYTIFFLAGDREFKVMETVMGTPVDLGVEQYADYDIPKTAVIACMAWWAGAGDVFYAEKKADDLYVIMHGEIGEGMEPDSETIYTRVLDARLR